MLRNVLVGFASLVLCCLSSLSSLLAAENLENIRFTHITVNHGLTNNIVNDIVRDNRGFVWFGTRGGLCRYDGYRIKQYLHQENDPGSLAHNFVTSFTIDPRDRLWICTEGGISRYDADADKFVNYYAPTSDGKEGKFVLQMRDGTIVAAFRNVLCIYDEFSDSFREVSPGITSVSPYTCGIEGADGVIWTGSMDGMRIIDLKSKTALNLFDPGNEDFKYLRSKHILDFYRDPSGKMYIASHGRGIFVCDPSSGKIKNISLAQGLSSEVVRCLAGDAQGRIWAGGESGIDVLDTEGHPVFHFKHSQSDRSNINDNAIYSIYWDRDGNLWAGSYFGGVNACFADYLNFTYYPFGYSDHHLSGKAVRQIISAGPSSLWIATEDGGLNLLDKKTGVFRHYDETTSGVRLSYHNVHTLVKDRRGYLWIGTFTGGVNRLNVSSGRMEYFNDANAGVLFNDTFTMIEDRNGDNIWIGGGSGLKYYAYSTGKFMAVTHPLINSQHVYALLQDSSGLIWVGTRRAGVFTYDPSSGNAYKFDPGTGFDAFITQIYEDSKSNIWICSNDGGVMLYNRASDQKSVYTTANGLLSNSVMSVIEDKEGQMWISTTAGLCCLDTSVHTFSYYTVESGLPTNQFNYASSYAAPDGELYFGTNNGMVAFYPDRMRNFGENSMVVFTGLSINGVPVEVGQKIDRRIPLPKSMMQSNQITLSNRQAKMFSLDFTSANFNGGRMEYYMMLDNSKWQPIGSQQKVTFSNFSAGQHTIKFCAAYAGQSPGADGGQVTVLDVRVLPSFWMSWPAFFLYMALVFAAFLLIFRLAKMRLRYQNSIRLERMEKDALKELNKHKITFFTNISHELKTPLTLILSPLNSLTQDKSIPEKARGELGVVTRNARRMLTMIDEQMTFSKIEMGREEILVQYGPVLPFIDQMCHIFRTVAATKSLTLITDIDGNDDTGVWFSPPTLEKIIYNLVSNAIKFTNPGGTIIVSARLEPRPGDEKYLCLDVTDTGIGISEESISRIFENYYQVNPEDGNNGSGIGLAFTKALVLLHRGTIGVSSQLGKGAMFTVELNVSESAYAPCERSTVKLDGDYAATYNYAVLSTENVDYDRTNGDQQLPEGGRRRLLVVEDNRELNDFICGLFAADYTVVSALDGRQGYEMAVKESPDLIICDVMMPEMDGYQLTRKIKTSLSTSHIPVVLLTAKTALEDTIEGLEYGADAYIKKPFNAKMLILQVGNIIKTRYNNILKFKGSPDMDISGIAYTSKDEKFLKDVMDFIKQNIDNESLSVVDITAHIGISRSMLYLKLKNMLDVSVTDLIRDIRFSVAKEKLRTGSNVSETSYAVGIADPNYFTKCFKKQFGITPTEYVKSLKDMG